MLLRNITTALKFYLSSPLIQVDQGGGGGVGGGGKRDGKASEVCVHALVLFFRTLPPCVPVTPTSTINATPPFAACQEEQTALQRT